MTVTSVAYKHMLNASEAYHQVISENLSNINTPKYLAKTVMLPDGFSDLIRRNIKLAVTNPLHMLASSTNSEFAIKNRKGLELKPNGNNVSASIEAAELSKNADNRKAAINSYKALTDLVSYAIGT